MTTKKYCFDTLEPAVNELYQLVRQVSQTESTILIQGESGTGKEALCHLIHQKSIHAENALVTINCGAIPEALIEAELFGYEPGAFTGAVEVKDGKFTVAQNGTILLDQISELNLKIQAKLLRVLESREYYPLGSQTPKRMNARIIATTTRDLQQLVEEGKFREDLYYRLNIVKLVVPPLRERKRDIPLLVDYFLNNLAKDNGKAIEFSPEVFHFLCQKEWEGNIRELSNFVTRLYFMSSTDTLTVHDLNQEHKSFGIDQKLFTVPSSDLPLQEIEKKYILHTLKHHKGNKSRTARSLKISLKTLRNKLKEYEFDVPLELITSSKGGRPSKSKTID